MAAISPCKLLLQSAPVSKSSAAAAAAAAKIPLLFHFTQRSLCKGFLQALIAHLNESISLPCPSSSSQISLVPCTGCLSDLLGSGMLACQNAVDSSIIPLRKAFGPTLHPYFRLVMDTVGFFPLYLQPYSSAEVQLFQPSTGETLIHLGSISKGLVCNPCLVSSGKFCMLGMLEFI